jgi:hypothetical protein
LQGARRAWTTLHDGLDYVILNETGGVSFVVMGEAMRWIIVATAAAIAVLAVMLPVPHHADAATITTPARIGIATKGTNLLHDIACRRMWRCGPWGCGWRPVCWYEPYSDGYRGSSYYYVYEGPYGYGYLYGGPHNGNDPYWWARPYYPPYRWTFQ